MIQARALGVLGVADGPSEPLDELRYCVSGAQMYRVHLLVEQSWRVIRELGRVGCDDNSGHEGSFESALIELPARSRENALPRRSPRPDGEGAREYHLLIGHPIRAPHVHRPLRR